MQFNNVWILFNGFIDFMLKSKSLLDYTTFINLMSITRMTK